MDREEEIIETIPGVNMINFQLLLLFRKVSGLIRLVFLRNKTRNRCLHLAGVLALLGHEQVLLKSVHLLAIQQCLPRFQPYARMPA